MTVDDFKKLIKLSSEGYHIFCDGEEVQGLMFDEDMDPADYVDSREQIVCSFVFTNDRYTTVQCLTEYLDSEWTVEKHEEVDWRSLDK